MSFLRQQPAFLIWNIGSDKVYKISCLFEPCFYPVLPTAWLRTKYLSFLDRLSNTAFRSFFRNLYPLVHLLLCNVPRSELLTYLYRVTSLIPDTSTLSLQLLWYFSSFFPDDFSSLWQSFWILIMSSKVSAAQSGVICKSANCAFHLIFQTIQGIKQYWN